jgi:hypothetical protein
VSWPRISYVARVMLPLSFLPLLAPRWLWLAAPTLALNLISHWPTATRLDSHYLSAALPALTVATLIGLARAQTWAPRLAHAALIAPVLASVWLGGLPWSLDFEPQAFTADAQTEACRAFVAQVPTATSLQAPDRLLPHVAERAVVHRGLPPERGTEYVVLDVEHRRRFAQREDLLRTSEEPLTRAWLARDDHAVVHVTAPWLLLQRGAPPRRGWSQRYFVAAATIADETLEASPALRLTDCVAIAGSGLRPCI